MCGIAGLFDDGRNSVRHVIAEMISKLSHRGPDSCSHWIDEELGLAIGHTRLSILDLSTGGSQPMASHSGRWIISYNGEIYNYKEIRSELQNYGIKFRSHSDTEVILEAVSYWGLDKTLSKLVGMFAFALWDRKEKALYLARDHLGIKPLYWTCQNGLFLFASELKALKCHPDICQDVDSDALAAFFRFGYVPAPLSIYRGVKKLQPGSVLQWSLGDIAPSISCFWNLKDHIGGSSNKLEIENDEAVVGELDDLLQNAVAQQMVADVPLGALLSGGVDSSLVTAMMQAQSSRPVKSFSIGFDVNGYDESQHAKAVARHLGTDHTELFVKPEHALDILPNLPYWYDEPFADSSAIPTFLVSELTKQHVTVALTGDGGDEIFAGYNRYFWGKSIWNLNRHTPFALRKTAAGVIRSLSPGFLNRTVSLLPTKYRIPHPADKASKVADLITQPDAASMYRQLVSYWSDPSCLVINGSESPTIINDVELETKFDDFTAQMQFLDTVTYLPDDILTKVDRASMAVSLETRVPLLDHRVVEFAWRQPIHRKIRDGQGKWLLRQVLDRYVPRKLIDRPKMGFSVPVGMWLKGPLRDWAEALLDPLLLRQQGFLNVDVVRSCWSEHLSGKRDWSYRLWAVLMFQAWLENESRTSL